jgi:hypothetical protein
MCSVVHIAAAEKESGTLVGNRASDGAGGVVRLDRMCTSFSAHGSIAMGLTIPELQNRPAIRTERVGALTQTGTTTLAFRS